jgi:predicted RecB family nuclease
MLPESYRFHPGGAEAGRLAPDSVATSRSISPLSPPALPPRAPASFRVSKSFVPRPQPFLPTPEDARSPLVITDEILLSYQRCSRRAFLDLYEQEEQRDQPNDYSLKLRRSSQEHQRWVLEQHQPVHTLSYPRQDWKAAAAATLELMQQGVERIAHGVLHVSWGDRLDLVSYPKLLVRQPDPCRWGDWHYVPVDIKLGKRPKADYQIVAAFQAYLLSELQGRLPDNSWLVLRQRGAYAVCLEEMLPRMEEVLQECIRTLSDPQEPEVFIAHSRCDLCHWYSHCYAIAQADHHLSLLPGVTPTRYAQLQALKVQTVEALANLSPKSLEGLPGFGAQVAHRLVQQAKATATQQALPYVEPAADAEGEGDRPLLSTEELPTAAVELYFDVEAAPEQNLIYLHGILVVDHEAQTEAFHALLAESVEDEPQVWQQFLTLVERYPNAPIFHFCPYEAQVIRKLAIAHGMPETNLEPLMQRFVDVHERITRVAVLPIESYALKSIARWVGFQWRDLEANGAQSICWYDQWQTTGDRTYLDAILRYNEDDCRATYQVKHWLAQFVQLHASLG